MEGGTGDAVGLFEDVEEEIEANMVVSNTLVDRVLLGCDKKGAAVRVFKDCTVFSRWDCTVLLKCGLNALLSCSFSLFAPKAMFSCVLFSV
jgi:hypothetical protein